MLLVRHPDTYEPERRYVFDVVLREFFGLEWRSELAEIDHIELAVDGQNGGPRLRVVDGLFATPEDQWLTPSSMPQTPLAHWDPAADGIPAMLVDRRLPVLYPPDRRRPAAGGDGEEQLSIDVDLFGGIFFMLSRYEELITAARDEHERFPSSASLAVRAGFLQRPIADEYVEVLRCAIEHLWPRLGLRRGSFAQRLSHDVDYPVHPGWSVPAMVKAFGGDLLSRRDLSLATARVRSLVARTRGRPTEDPYFCFDLIMDLSEERGLRSSFYFMTGRTDPRYDGAYSLREPWMEALIARIHARGHEIGLHPSYGTFRDPELIRAERDALIETCERLGVTQAAWGGRQHYLRWENPITWRGWEEAGLAYDSSLGYGGDPGFRCGTCHEYPAYDLIERRSLRLRERPLVVMETGVTERAGQRASFSLEKIEHLRNRCRAFGGLFTLLWHNSRLASSRERRLYRAAI